jgi:hypothetical protein
MPLDSFYIQQVNSYSQKLQGTQRMIVTVAFLRLVAFIAAAIAVYFYIRYNEILIAIAAAISILSFFLLIKWNFRLNEEKALLQKLIFINNNEKDVLNDEPNKFGDGEEYLSDEGFGNDIDVFGPASLYHLLNRTTTSHGRDQLAALLQFPLLDKPDIENYQEGIKIMSQQTTLRQLLTANGLMHGEKEGTLHHIGTWLNTPNKLHEAGWVNVVRWVLPVCNILALLFYWSSDNYIPLGLTVTASWICIGIFAKYISHQHALVGKKQAILDQYASILKEFSAIQEGSSSLLKNLQSDSSKACSAIDKLSQLSGLLDQRMNLVVNIFLNSFLVYDLHCLWALERWKSINKEFFEKWIQCVGNIEALNSLATFAYNYPDYCQPVVLEQGLNLECKSLAHPLIHARERIANDLELGRSGKLALVTGSNMSGKTTFLRTVGINVLLAQCGAPVCATQFSFTPMQLLTAIRISDSLQLHTSYFMAELKRLKNIIEHLQTGNPSLVLVDEILRGTNSDDKSHGSEEFIKKIITFNCLTLFATHDLSLSTLQNEFPGIVTNYCFESTIVNAELSFDYKLQQGVAKNKNASFLMKKMDII